MNSRPFCINHPVRTFWVILSKRTLAVLRLWRWALLPCRCWALCSHVPWASLFDTNIKTCEMTKGDSVFLYLFNVTMLPVYEVHCSIKLDWMRCFINIKSLYIKMNSVPYNGTGNWPNIDGVCNAVGRFVRYYKIYELFFACCTVRIENNIVLSFRSRVLQNFYRSTCNLHVAEVLTQSFFNIKHVLYLSVLYMSYKM
uniref:Uncharacterized protein n=1 Tax=Cacopsylla melanoneura TaxID=428564 RepID=A0A8D8X7X8_9HEMI